MRIFLIGFMGSGKTTIGQQLASQMNYSFIDLDTEIEKLFNLSVSDIFEKTGEKYFREAENDILKSTFKTDDIIVSTGGGVPCFYDNMKLMNQAGTTIYIKTDPKTLAHRLKKGQHTRPLIKDKDEAQLLQYITEKLNEREQFYNQAKITVNAIGLTPSHIITLLK